MSVAGDDELPELYGVQEHHERFASLSPSDKLNAFLRLPQWQRREAALTLRLEFEQPASVEAMAVAA